MYRIWSSGAEYDLFEDDAAAYDPDSDPTHSPAARDVDNNGVIDATELKNFPGWFDRTDDELLLTGRTGYFRYQGNFIPGVPPIVDGQTELLFTVEGGSLSGIPGNPLFADWWTHPKGAANPETFEIWQSWNIGDPYTVSNNWIGSEDSGRFYIIPEPMTMLGVFLGVSSLTGYLRKRRMA